MELVSHRFQLAFIVCDEHLPSQTQIRGGTVPRSSENRAWSRQPSEHTLGCRSLRRDGETELQLEVHYGGTLLVCTRGSVSGLRTLGEKAKAN